MLPFMQTINTRRFIHAYYKVEQKIAFNFECATNFVLSCKINMQKLRTVTMAILHGSLPHSIAFSPKNAPKNTCFKT